MPRYECAFRRWFWALDFHHGLLGEGRKGYIIQRYKGLGEMTAEQLWETTMDPERRTLLQVRLEDIAECESISTTLMGEDVEARRKFIETRAKAKAASFR